MRAKLLTSLLLGMSMVFSANALANYNSSNIDFNPSNLQLRVTGLYNFTYSSYISNSSYSSDLGQTYRGPGFEVGVGYQLSDLPDNITYLGLETGFTRLSDKDSGTRHEASYETTLKDSGFRIGAYYQRTIAFTDNMGLYLKTSVGYKHDCVNSNNILTDKDSTETINYDIYTGKGIYLNGDVGLLMFDHFTMGARLEYSREWGKLAIVPNQDPSSVANGNLTFGLFTNILF